MDPHKTVAALVSGLSVALLTASILRDTTGPDTPLGANSFLQHPLHSATTRGSVCREVYTYRFYDAILDISPNATCRPQLPTGGDCGDTLQVKQRRKGTSCSHIGCEQNPRKKPFRRERSKVAVCDLPKGSLHCWHRLTQRWLNKEKPRPIDNCIMIYPSLPSSPPQSPVHHTSLPDLSPDPTPLPSVSTASNQPHLITHPFIYTNGAAALAWILPHLAPLPSGTNSSYIYLTCNSTRPQPAGFPLQKLMVVHLLLLTTSEPQGPGGSSSHASHIKVTILPGVSRASFYRNYPLSTHTLQEMEQAQGAAILDFPLYQASGDPRSKTPFITELLSHISNYSLSDITLDPVVLTGNTPCKSETKNATYNKSDINEEEYTEDTLSSYVFSHASAIDYFLCSAVHIQHSWWNSTELIDVQKVSDYVNLLQVELSELVSKTGKFPISVSVFQQPKGHRLPGYNDELLASHVQQLGGSMSNTIHAILSEGGTIYNKYTSYTRIEESNPILIFIIPHTTKGLMPQDYLRHLRVNSHGLVTTADVALTVLSLADLYISSLHVSTDLSIGYTPESLVLKEIKQKRSCEFLGIQAPHLCICEGEWTPADNDTVYVGLAELAVASLNEIIRRQAEGSATHRDPFYSSSPYAICLKLIGLSFYDVQVRREGAMLVTRLSLVVAQKTHNVLTRGATPLTDSFHVTLGTDFSRQEVAEMRMLGYIRTSNIGGRRGCSAGTGVAPDLCLCIPGTHKHWETPDSILRHLQQTHFGVRPKLIHLHHPCLLLSIRQYGDSDSVTFTAVNTCDTYMYNVTLRVVAVSVILSQTNPNTVVLHPLCEVTLNVVMKASYYTPSSKVGYQVSYTFMNE